LPGKSHQGLRHIRVNRIALAEIPQSAILCPSNEAEMDFDHEIDCGGLMCPLPVLKARKRLIGMQPKAVLKVLVTDKMAEIDLPHFCAEAGHHYLGHRPEGTATAHFLRRTDRA
jgi:tRNA 2-thiouridine synthesizing protein A